MNPEMIQQIRSRRILLGITQGDLSEISGVSVRTIKAIEKGTGNPTIDVLSRLLEAVGLKLTTVERVSNG
jgi:transcriptional regulator with XRE-family HTH domain